MSPIDIIIVGGFLLFVLFIGNYLYRWIAGTGDYYVAGRELGPFMMAATMAATNMSVYSLLGEPGIAYQSGISIVWHEWTGNMAFVLAGLFVVPLYRRLRVCTIPEFLELRYGYGMRALVAVFWIFKYAFNLGIGVYLLSLGAMRITGIDNFTFWVLIMGLVVVAFTVSGGAWSVSVANSLQFMLLIGGGLLVLPIAMKAVDWFPGLVASLPAGHLNLVPKTGDFNWIFILSIFLLGVEAFTLDQGILQRTLSARDLKSVVKSMVLVGVILTPFNLICIFPGLAASVLYPGLAEADQVIPHLIQQLVPTGLLGLVVCGLLASQMSAVGGLLNSAGTMFTHDIYQRAIRPKASQRETLLVARGITLFIGILILCFAHIVPLIGGAVRAYLTVIGCTDMPLFVVAVVYGMFWRRINQAGALAGFLGGAATAAVAHFGFGVSFNIITFIGSGVALVVAPLVSFLTRPLSVEKLNAIWKARATTAAEIEAGTAYRIIPKSIGGRLSMLILLAGFVLFFVCLWMGDREMAQASLVSLIAMGLFFSGGLLRLFFD
jgi:SSS family solute:Na+ symporter